MEYTDDTLMICNPAESPISSSAPAPEAPGSSSLPIGPEMIRCHSVTSSTEAVKDTLEAPLSYLRHIENSSARKAKECRKYPEPSANLTETIVINNTLQTSEHKVLESGLVAHRQVPSDSSYTPSYEEDAQNSLHIIGEENPQVNESKVEIAEIGSELYASSSELRNINSSYLECSLEQTHSQNVLKPSPPAAAANDHECETNEFISLFDKENVQKGHEAVPRQGVAQSGRSSKCAKRKRARRPSSNSQDSVDDGDEDEKQVCILSISSTTASSF